MVTLKAAAAKLVAFRPLRGWYHVHAGRRERASRSAVGAGNPQLVVPGPPGGLLAPCSRQLSWGGLGRQRSRVGGWEKIVLAGTLVAAVIESAMRKPKSTTCVQPAPSNLKLPRALQLSAH